MLSHLSPFGFSQTEFDLAGPRPEAFRIRRVYDLMGEARFYTMKPLFG